MAAKRDVRSTKDNLKNQVLGPIIVALLVGSSAPWWFGLVSNWVGRIAPDERPKPTLETWLEYRTGDPDGARYMFFRQGKNEPGWVPTGLRVCAYTAPMDETTAVREMEAGSGRRRQAFRTDQEKEDGWNARGTVLHLASRSTERTQTYYEYWAPLPNNEGLKYALFGENRVEPGWQRTDRRFYFFKCS